jgi:DNA-directed RNA polymerase specialized sigma24 family protein
MVYLGSQFTASIAARHLPQERTKLASFGSERAHSTTETLSELFELYYDRIARYISSRIGNRDLAEDMASDFFVRAVESYGTYEQRGLHVQAWLFRIAHNLIIDHYPVRPSAKACPSKRPRSWLVETTRSLKPTSTSPCSEWVRPCSN